MQGVFAIQGSRRMRLSVGNHPSKHPKIVEVSRADRVNDGPVHRFALMDGEVAKTHRAFHALREFTAQRAVGHQRVERAAHRRWRSVATGGDAMKREINTELNSAA